jgi:putative Mg2+ transporter-C (MgtC) family protein
MSMSTMLHPNPVVPATKMTPFLLICLLCLIGEGQAWGSLQLKDRQLSRVLNLKPAASGLAKIPFRSVFSVDVSFCRSRDTPRSSALDLHSQYSQDDEQKRAKRRRRLVVLACLGLAVVLLPLRSASAASTLLAVDPLVEAPSIAAVAASASALSQSYSSNPPMPVLTINSPVSTITELRLTLRMFYAAFLGSLVGKERSRSARHAAGVGTMALVCLGAAVFTICSMYGFAAAGRYDPSRMAANVASGVGFVGAGVITTTSAPMQPGGDRHETIVHGLTTAAAIWLSAAIGVACGVGMPILGTAAAMGTMTILRVNQVTKKNKSKSKSRRDVATTLQYGHEMMERSLLQNETLAHQHDLDRAWNETEAPLSP